jgi:hypothetical protein
VDPTGLLRHPEDALSEVLVAILRIGVRFGLKGVVALLEGVGDLLEEDEAEHDVLVLGGVPLSQLPMAFSFSMPITSPCPTAKRLGHDLMRPTKELLRPVTGNRWSCHAPDAVARYQVNCLIVRMIVRMNAAGIPTKRKPPSSPRKAPRRIASQSALGSLVIGLPRAAGLTGQDPLGSLRAVVR